MMRLRSCLALGILAMAAIAAIAVPGATATSETKQLRVIISEKGHIEPLPPAGKFVLSGAAADDSGTSVITPGHGPERIRDGQSFATVSGTDSLTGKKGDLLIRFDGISVSAATHQDVDYGTWRIYTGFGTGMYKGWKGGGRWAAIDRGRSYVIRFEGLVTGP